MHCGVHHTRKTECTHSHTRQGRERQRCGTACSLSSTADAEEGGAAYSVDYKPEATTKMTQWNFTSKSKILNVVNLLQEFFLIKGKVKVKSLSHV